ncbi:MAG: helix-turn-helix transcriptional regulator [Ruminococcaceae bacterium]|nr:helix-turn-helix transcriptional regulator [Oscillospiraceae bacterium]
METVSSRFYTEYFPYPHREGADKNRGGEELTHLLFLLFYRLFEKIDPPLEPAISDAARRKSNKYIHRIDAYIAGKKGDVTLEELAQSLYLSPKQVSRIIRKEYGCSFPTLLNQRKLTTACMLLKYTDLSVSQIAAEVGYTYENYFFTRFKGAYGLTPLQYRREHKS